MAEPTAESKTTTKPEPKVEAPSPEAVALADAIDSGIAVEYTEQPGGAVTPASPPATSKETEPKPEDKGKKPPDKGESKIQAKTPASKEEPSGGTPEDGKPKEGDEDPFKGLEAKDILAKLLGHPEVGPVLQRWADQAGEAQSASAVEQERGTIADEARTQAEDAHWDEHFKDMSEEEVGEELAKDSKAAVAYSRYKQRLEAKPELDPDRVTRASKVYGYAIQVATYDLMVKDSKLPDEKKAELKAENFKDHGPEGIIAWGNAVYSALIEHEAEIRANELLNERWETFQQEHMAETDGDRPPMVRGRKVAGTLPDLIKTDTSVLFEDAFTRTAQEKT